MCGAVIRKYHFELREVSRYLQLTKIAAYEPTHNEKYPFPFMGRRELQFALSYIVPIMIGLKISNLQRYDDFIEGRYYTPSLEFKDVLYIGFFNGLLAYNETFGQGNAQKTTVKLESKLQDVYTAIWGTDYNDGMNSKAVGELEFTANIKTSLLQIVGGMSIYSNVNY